MPRLTRKQQQAHTRTCLMEAAAKVFKRRGLQQASIDEVAEDAGYTKGAFYANFKSKEELFLAMLDERFATRLDEIDRVIQSDAGPEEKAAQAGADFTRHVTADPEWQRLFFEFAAYAARNEEFREELATRYRSMRERMTAAYERRAEEHGGTPPIPFEQVALMTCAMANGVALEHLIEPEAVDDDLYGRMLAVFFAGVKAMAEREHAALAR
jgi:AcrR family transcriptional regulator